MFTFLFISVSTAQKLCESRGGHPGLPVPNGPHGFCGLKATLNQSSVLVREAFWPRGWKVAGKQKDLGSIPLWLSFLFRSCGLWTLSYGFVHV